MTTLWEQDFDVYMTEMDDAPASFVIDVRAPGQAPVASHPLLLVYEVPMRNPLENGLRSGEELEALGDLEDHVVEQLSSQLDAIYVGRVVHDGATTMYFYLPALAPEELERIGDVVGSVEPYEAEWSVEEDPEWQCCVEFLAPDDYSRQTMLNRRLLGLMTEKGDQIQVARPIDHFALFPNQQALQSAASRLADAGFKLAEPNEPSEDNPMWSLEFQRDDVPGDGGADRFCDEILDIVLDLDGSYDGWGSPLVEG